MLRWMLIFGGLISGAVLLGVAGWTYNMPQLAFAALIAFTVLSVMGVVFRETSWKKSR